jgi:hypothetical protein
MKLLKVPLVLCFLLFLSLAAQSQTVDQLATTVVYLEHSFSKITTNGNQSVTNQLTKSGTGFLLQYNDSLYLITAKHVGIDLGFTTNDTVSIANLDGSKSEFELPVLQGPRKAVWLHHPEVDVSVLPLEPMGQTQILFSARSLQVSNALAKWTNAPPRDRQLIIIGFPLGIGARVGDDFGPLTRRTRAASRLLQNGTIFLLEDPSIQGYSGSPVIYSNEPTRLGGVGLGGGPATEYFGVVTSTLFDDTGGKLAGVVPIKWVAQLIFEDQKKRGKAP